MSTAPLHLRGIGGFDIFGLIREGTNAPVYKAKDKATGTLVALKVLTGDSYDFKNTRALNEELILKKLQHDNIIKLKDKFASEDDICMVYEYMDHDLKRFLKNKRPTLQEHKSYIKQMLTGIDYCHCQKVLHLDLKCSNLLINVRGTLKLCDFGVAKDISENENGESNSSVTSLWYRPPELLLGSTHHGTAVDMWSVGCVIAEMFLGEPILQGESEEDQLNKIFQLCGSPNDPNWRGQSESSQPSGRNMKEAFKDLHEGVLDLLEHLLVLDPSQRWSAKDCLSAKYFCELLLPESPFRYDLQTEIIQEEEMEIEILLREAMKQPEEIEEIPIQTQVPQPLLQPSQSRHPQARRHQPAGRRAVQQSSRDSMPQRQSPYQWGARMFHPYYSQGTGVLYGVQNAPMPQHQSAFQQFPESQRHGLQQTRAGLQIENFPARFPFYGPITAAHDVYGHGSGSREASRDSRYEQENAPYLQTEPWYTMRTGPELGMREGPSLGQFQGGPHHRMITAPSLHHSQGYSYHVISTTTSGFGSDIMAAGPNLRQGVDAYPISLRLMQQQRGRQPPLLATPAGMTGDLTAYTGQPWWNDAQQGFFLQPGSTFTGQLPQYNEAGSTSSGSAWQQYGGLLQYGMSEVRNAYGEQRNAAQQGMFQPSNAFTGHSLQYVEAEMPRNARPSQNNTYPGNSLAARPQNNASPSSRQSQTNFNTGPFCSTSQSDIRR